MNESTTSKNNDTIEIIRDKNYFYIKLDYNFGGIVGSHFIQFELERNIFNKENNCKKIRIFLEPKVYYFYYCKNDFTTIQKIKNNFPKISFINNQLNYNFTINPNDLFIKKNEFIYCLMVFSMNIDNGWVFGSPFLKNYQFMFELDSKKIFFYSSKNQVEISGINKRTLIKIIFVLSIAFLILGFFIGRIIYRRHFKKLRINELDDTFEYNSIEKKEKKIKMTRQLF